MNVRWDNILSFVRFYFGFGRKAATAQCHYPIPTEELEARGELSDITFEYRWQRSSQHCAGQYFFGRSFG